MSRHCDFTPQTCAELHNTAILVTETKTRVTNLESWQDRQNGSLAAIHRRLNHFLWFLVGIFATSAGSLLTIILLQRN